MGTCYHTMYRKRDLKAFSGLLIFALSLCLFSACRNKNSENPQPSSTQPDTLNLPQATGFDIKALFPYYFANNASLPTDNPATKEGVFLGRALFYEKALSADGTISCASCHKPELAFTDGGATSKGVGGQFGTRSSMSLQNLALQRKFFWDGRSNSLEDQAKFPITAHFEMGETMENVAAKLQNIKPYPRLFKQAFGYARITPLNIQRALAQFERTLVSKNSKYDQFLLGQYQPDAQESLGMALFFTHPVADDPRNIKYGGNCGDCHTNINTFGNITDYSGFKNNGLATSFPPGSDLGLESITNNPDDRGKFKIPSLRNIAITAPYMHNGSLKTLYEVLDHYNSTDLFSRPNVDGLIPLGSNQRFGKSLGLTASQKTAIIAFLNMLTDSSFVTDTAYRAPVLR